SNVEASLKAGDPFYNPCVGDEAGSHEYLQKWKKQNFACTPLEDKSVSAYTPVNYQLAKDLWTKEIDDTHASIMAQVAQNAVQLPHLRQLRDLITSTKPWAQRSEIGALADYVAGKPVAGFDYAAYFGKNDIVRQLGAKAAPAKAAAKGSLGLLDNALG